MNDCELLGEFVEQASEPAFARLVERHVDLVYSAALRRTGGNHHRAQEVTQMVFTDFARKASRLRNHPLLAGWLHRSTRWAAAGLRRAELRRIAYEQAAATEYGATVAAPPSDWARLAPLLDDALDALNERDREAVLLRFFNDRPFAEIGTKLGLTETAARMRVSRALEKLRAVLARRGVVSTAAALALELTQNSVRAAPPGTATLVTSSVLSSVSSAGTVAATVWSLFMTKLQLALAGAVATALAVGLAFQLEKNHRFHTQLAELQAQAEAAQAGQRTSASQLAEQQERARKLDAAITAQVTPLTPAQQERLRLDTVIRKGELDREYTPLFRRLQLDLARLDEFKALLVERNQAIFDAVKLAKNQSFEPASYTEERLIGESAAGEIDQRIAALLGATAADQFHEFATLQPYRLLAEGLVASGPEFDPKYFERRLTPEFDKQIDQVAALMAAVAPTLPDDAYRANGWPVGYPPALLEALGKILPADALARIHEEQAMNATLRRMFEIARQAALQGKLKLSKSSARDYPVSQDAPSTPVK